MADLNVSEFERDHIRARARELTYAAGVPLRDLYGFAASDEQVDTVLAGMLAHPDDATAAAERFGVDLLPNPIAMATDIPTDEAYELRIAEALAPLVAEHARRQAVSRG